MPHAASKVRVTGPLAPFAEGLRHHLLDQGYTPLSTANVLRLAAHLSRWMHARRVPAALTPTLAAQFVHHRRRRAYTQFRSTRSLRPILSYLASVGAIAWTTEAERRPACPLLQRYGEYLTTERGLTAPSVRQYAATAARFLDAHADVRHLPAAAVTDFVLRESRRYGTGTTKHMVSILRSLLRYLHVAGEMAADRTGAVPPVAGWRLVGVPTGATAEDVGQLVRGCNRRTAAGPPRLRRHPAVVAARAARHRGGHPHAGRSPLGGRGDRDPRQGLGEPPAAPARCGAGAGRLRARAWTRPHPPALSAHPGAARGPVRGRHPSDRDPCRPAGPGRADRAASTPAGGGHDDASARAPRSLRSRRCSATAA